jgi:O-succinylbenzoate synthase
MTEDRNAWLHWKWEFAERPFSKPFYSASGSFSVRSSIILKATNPLGSVGVGEIAPWPGFETESLIEAASFLQGLPKSLSTLELEQLVFPGPCTAFAFHSMVMDLAGYWNQPAMDISIGLLKSKDMDALSALLERPLKGCKWKIGVDSIEQEIADFERIQSRLPSDWKIRLDANGGLNLDSLEQWVSFLKQYPQVEFLEQPLPIGAEMTMNAFQLSSGVRMALDESVRSESDLIRFEAAGWLGDYVIKPALWGDPRRLIALSPQFSDRLIISSVFESAVVHRQIAVLAHLCSTRAAGLDTLSL